MVAGWIWLDHLNPRIIEGLEREELYTLLGMIWRDPDHYSKGNYGTNMRPLVF